MDSAYKDASKPMDIGDGQQVGEVSCIRAEMKDTHALCSRKGCFIARICLSMLSIFCGP